eukprot:3121764-Amphidinium_carterae.1
MLGVTAVTARTTPMKITLHMIYTTWESLWRCGHTLSSSTSQTDRQYSDHGCSMTLARLFTASKEELLNKIRSLRWKCPEVISDDLKHSQSRVRVLLKQQKAEDACGDQSGSVMLLMSIKVALL